jgi:hypothetical protein
LGGIPQHLWPGGEFYECDLLAVDVAVTDDDSATI